ncbi:MAG: phosphate signaling complex protein PhoU [Candidatus Hydrogenedentes bacterium]|nr:phosphate signaling complex protein PhoU [Candidatus Hydrogenedentota bacterium]
MPRHLQRAIEQLKTHLLCLGTRVEESLRDAVEALSLRNRDQAEMVIQLDKVIDDLEVELEEECLKILALHQPVAIDLRFIVATLKINNDLERVGDLSVNIAERTIFLSQYPPVGVALDFETMTAKAQWMLRNSLDSLVHQNTALARAVCTADDEVDEMNREMYIQVQAAIRRNPAQLEVLIHLLSISRHLERIADLATNIAEDVIYMFEGEIVRHQVEIYAQE